MPGTGAKLCFGRKCGPHCEIFSLDKQKDDPPFVRWNWFLERLVLVNNWDPPLAGSRVSVIFKMHLAGLVLTACI
jgi:hypothetical protein